MRQLPLALVLFFLLTQTNEADSCHRRNRACDCGQERNEQEDMSSYCCSSCRSASPHTPETVPVNTPVFVKSTGALEALNNTGDTVEVNVRVPEALLKRPVPPVIL